MAKRPLRAIVLLLTLSAGTSTIAQEAPLPLTLKACAKQSDGALRLACYDTEIAKLSSTTPGPTAAERTTSSPSSTENQFGIEHGPLARKAETGPQANKITAKVIKVDKLTSGAAVVSLDNNQVWQQIRTEAYFPIKQDDVVVISTGLMGVYWLEAPFGRATKVKRIK